ncbi:amidohydrolase [Maribacter sp. ACAM166]|uniref:amidohydrolase n=1 Tax=Maribacter sp. ACAM166 TaxID=2508996 RepID=UPI0010FDD9BB|nr:amidohydrolase [Maribacter sp. ACAM166]TLP73214.1 amidohydrolase [Maribacter sp. ACAM166]
MIKDNIRLKIALIQSSLHWENPIANRAMFSSKLEQIAADIDVIVLPEMFTTGFTMSPEQISEEEGLLTLEWMKEIASNKDCAIFGSTVYKEQDFFYNRLFFVKPDGEYFTYDKRHTFTLAGEHKNYKSGSERLVVEYKGFKFCPLICYDLRFPVWSRNTENIDLLLFVANWPAPRINAWDTLLKARAIENMVYCIGVNRIGVDKQGHHYPGHSSVYDSLGKLLVHSKQEEILIVEVTKNSIDETRTKLPFLEDRDQFNLLN